MGFNVLYSPQSISIKQTSVSISQIIDRVTDKQAIISLMKEKSGLVSATEIARTLGKSESTIRVKLSKMKNDGTVTNPSTGMWGLIHEE